MIFENTLRVHSLLKDNLPETISCNFTGEKTVELKRKRIQFCKDSFEVEYSTSFGDSAIISFYPSGLALIILPNEFTNADTLRILNFDLQNTVCRIWAERIYPELRKNSEIADYTRRLIDMHRDLIDLSSKVALRSMQLDSLFKTTMKVVRKLLRKLE